MKNPPIPLKILSPIKMSHLSKTLLLTEVGRSSQWKIISPMVMSPFLYLGLKLKFLMAHFKFSGDCQFSLAQRTSQSLAKRTRNLS